MKYFINHEVSTDDLRNFNLSTVGSLLVHGWLKRNGGAIEVTKAGHEAFALYSSAGPNYRQHAAELSDRVRYMLHMRALTMAAATPITMKKAG
jgi:hypothetical protein